MKYTGNLDALIETLKPILSERRPRKVDNERNRLTSAFIEYLNVVVGGIDPHEEIQIRKALYCIFRQIEDTYEQRNPPSKDPIE